MNLVLLAYMPGGQTFLKPFFPLAEPILKLLLRLIPVLFIFFDGFDGRTKSYGCRCAEILSIE